MAPRNSEKKPSAARRRAEQHQGGGDFSTLTLPEGMNFFKPKVGTYLIDIIPFTAGKGNAFAEPGELYYEKTFYVHPRIGSAGKSYICPAKMGVGKCPICEEHSRMGQDPDNDELARKALIPKQRQLFLVYVHKEAEKGVQLWEYSYHNFGKLLDSRVRNSDDSDGYDLFYYPDTDGLTLKVTFEEETSPYGAFINASSIDFKSREKPIAKSILAKAVCLDEMVKILAYKELYAILFETNDADETPKGKASGKKKPVDDDEDEDDEPAPKSKKTTTSKKPAPVDDDEDDEKDEDDTLVDDVTWLKGQGLLADTGNKAARAAIRDRAEAVDLDPSDFKSWKLCAKKIIELEMAEEVEDDNDDDDEPPAPKAKATTKKKPPVEDDDDEDFDDDDEPPAPKSKKPAPKTTTKKAPVEDDDDDFDDEDEEPAPKSKPKASTKKAPPVEDDEDDDFDDDEDDEPPPLKSKKPAPKSKKKPVDDDFDDDDEGLF